MTTMPSAKRSLLSQCVVGLLALILSACSVAEKGPRLDPFAAINPFQRFDPLAPPSPLASRVVAQWEVDLAKPGFLEDRRWHSQPGRDELIYRLILMADYRFNRYEADLVTGKATRDTFVDIAVLGLNAAGVLINPGQATRILAAISGGLISSRAAVERNFYQNQAQAVLLRKMKVLRAQKLYSISHHLIHDDVDHYPVERALIDVLDYYNRGTMLGALDAVSQDTAAQEIEVQGGQVKPPPREGLSPGTTLPLPTTSAFQPPAPVSLLGDGKSFPPEPVPPVPAPEPTFTPVPGPVPTPVPAPAPDPLHARKAALLHRVRRLSAQDATAAADLFAPGKTLPEKPAKTRLQAFIEHTTDETVLTQLESTIGK